ncbi:MobV family relaxase, partial [Malaciobacter mytili]
RERDTPNADPERLRHNMHMAARSTDEAMGKLREKLPEKRRKDAVLAIEYVLSASPEWWINADSGRKADFYQSSMDWLAEKYGRENILVSSIHLDEKTPHMSAFVVPITKDGRLSAKEFIGNRTKMSNDQSSYAEAVKHLGLVRGIEGSKATHKRIKAHYNALGQQIPVPPEIREEDLKPQSEQGPGLLGKIGLRPMIETPLGVA